MKPLAKDSKQCQTYSHYWHLNPTIDWMKRIDAKDWQIIRELQRDGRLTNLELSERVNLSPSPCLRRVRILEEAGVITG